MPLIGDSALNEQGPFAPLVEQRVDERLSPERLAVDDFDPRTVVGVDGGIAPLSKAGQRRRLADAGHARDENRSVTTHAN
ncbi:hypothetical protein EB75_05535 [Mycobacterium sp. ST-F2]|nr:hypothetical protein EB75_05535 [Mycobacterium sp. ST-F2]